MSKSTRKLIQTCKLICTILLVVLIGLQFIPYWYAEFTEKDSKLLSEEEYVTRQAELDAEAAARATSEVTTAPTGSNGIQGYVPEMEEEDIPQLMKISIAKYTWMFRVNRVNENIFMPVLVLVFAFAAVITYVKNTYSVACSIWGVLAPAVGLYGFLTVPLFSTGFSTAYLVNVIAHAVALAVTLGTLILRIVVLIKVIKKDRAERKAKSSFADQ